MARSWKAARAPVVGILVSALSICCLRVRFEFGTLTSACSVKRPAEATNRQSLRHPVRRRLTWTPTPTARITTAPFTQSVTHGCVPTNAKPLVKVPRKKIERNGPGMLYLPGRHVVQPRNAAARAGMTVVISAESGLASPCVATSRRRLLRRRPRRRKRIRGRPRELPEPRST